MPGKNVIRFPPWDIPISGAELCEKGSWFICDSGVNAIKICWTFTIKYPAYYWKYDTTFELMTSKVANTVASHTGRYWVGSNISESSSRCNLSHEGLVTSWSGSAKIMRNQFEDCFFSLRASRQKLEQFFTASDWKVTNKTLTDATGSNWTLFTVSPVLELFAKFDFT